MNAQERMEQAMKDYQKEHNLSDEEMQKARARGQQIVEEAMATEDTAEIELSEEEQEELYNL